MESSEIPDSVGSHRKKCDYIRSAYTTTPHPSHSMKQEVLCFICFALYNCFALSVTKAPHHATHAKLARCAVSSPDVISEGTIWSLRLFSACSGYLGFIGYFDRPRGQLNVVLDVDVEMKPSSVEGAGLGLFAKKSLPVGFVLGTYPGAVIPLVQNIAKLKKFPTCESYIWRFSDNKAVIDPTNAQGILEETCSGGNPAFPGSIMMFNTVFRPFFVKSTALCRINEPPRGKDVNVITSENLVKRCVIFQLERDVFAGEELFIDYGLSYDRSAYGRKPQS